MSCLLMPRVIGCSRLPVPPARMIPFMVGQRMPCATSSWPGASRDGAPRLDACVGPPRRVGDGEPAALVDDADGDLPVGAVERGPDTGDLRGRRSGDLGDFDARAVVGGP